MQQTRMVRLTTVGTSFHARVIAARLGSEGIVTDLRGNVDGFYPVGNVHVFVDTEDLDEAKEILMVDDVESAFDEPEDIPELGAPKELWLILGAVLAIAAVIFSRTF
jgi:sugar/nucleoside kinase (ribokinase family)